MPDLGFKGICGAVRAGGAERSDIPSILLAVLRAITRGNRVRPGRLHPESINTIVQRVITRAGLDPTNYSARSLRAGFVTYAHLRGASDRAIMHQTRHRSPTSVGTYTRAESAWVDNAATALGI